MVDSQSVKSTAVGGEESGCDGGKKVKGTKRHILVDTEGFVLHAKVHSANLLDQEVIKALLARADERFPASGEALVYAAMIRLMARRLACV